MGQPPLAPAPRSVQGPALVRRDVRRAAQAYADHLLAGGVTTWPAFLVEAGAGGAGPPRETPAWSEDPPGATQAELLRRLNRRLVATRTARPELAAHVLRRAVPGRGLVDLRLTDPPQRVPVPELLRIGAGVIADLVAELPHPEGRPEPADDPPRPSRRAPSYRLEGPPLTVSALRRGLVAAGLPPRGGRRWRLRRSRPDLVVVVALPLRRALLEVWSHRTQRGGTRSWHALLAEWRTTRRLPPGAAYDRLAAGWATRIGGDRVHVVTADDLDDQVAAVLGRPPAALPGSAPGAAALTPAEVEVVRRTSEVLTFRVPPQEKQAQLDCFVALLAERSSPRRGGAPATRPSHRRWLRATGRRTAARLRSGGYVVHGSLTSLGRTRRPVRGRAANRAVLAAMLGAVLRLDAARVGAHEERGAEG